MQKDLECLQVPTALSIFAGDRWPAVFWFNFLPRLIHHHQIGYRCYFYYGKGFSHREELIV